MGLPQPVALESDGGLIVDQEPAEAPAGLMAPSPV
jgi:hypothetical protein